MITKAKDRYFLQYFDLTAFPPFPISLLSPLSPPIISKEVGEGVHGFIFQAILLIFCMKASIVFPLISLLSKMEKIFPPYFFPSPPFFIIFHKKNK